MYAILRWMAGVALHWFYGDIRVLGSEKIPHHAPLLIAVNHPNALVDSLVIGWLMPRPVVMTAKATLFDNPFIAAFFRMLGVVPLRRARDEATMANTAQLTRQRNAGAFREILRVLSCNSAVLIFPEGISHSDEELAPLKPGLTRIALQARDANIRSVQILPIGLVYDHKATPGSRVAVRIAAPIDIDSWESDHNQLTAELTKRLRGVCEHKTVPSSSPGHRTHISAIKKAAITSAAKWGSLTHNLPIRIARRLAVNLATDADQPAMFTIVIGTGLVLATYAIHLTVVGALAHSFWITCAYLAALLLGAYWAAFEPHIKH